MRQKIQGGCLCGLIRYEVISEPLLICTCHCASCRKAAGSTNVTWAIFKKSDVKYQGNLPASYSSSESVKRTFCPTCGTTLTYERENLQDTIDITVASLDLPENFAPTAEVWMEDALPWEQINPALSHWPQDIP